MASQFDSKLVAHVAERCRCSETEAANALAWLRRHTNAFHGGHPDACPDCRASIREFGPMPDASLLRHASSAEIRYLKLSSGAYEKKTISSKLRAVILERDGNTCCHCGSSSDLTVDHIVPERLGGTLDPSNLQTLCRSCNSKKGIRKPVSEAA